MEMCKHQTHPQHNQVVSSGENGEHGEEGEAVRNAVKEHTAILGDAIDVVPGTRNQFAVFHSSSLFFKYRESYPDLQINLTHKAGGESGRRDEEMIDNQSKLKTVGVEMTTTVFSFS